MAEHKYDIGDNVVYESADGVIVVAEVEGVLRQIDGSHVYAVRAIVAEGQIAGDARFPDLKSEQILGKFDPPEPQWSFYEKMLQNYRDAGATLIDAGDRLINVMMRFSDKRRTGIVKHEPEED